MTIGVWISVYHESVCNNDSVSIPIVLCVGFVSWG